MKIEEFLLSKETAESCLLKVDGTYYYLTASMIAMYGKEITLKD